MAMVQSRFTQYPVLLAQLSLLVFILLPLGGNPYLNQSHYLWGDVAALALLSTLSITISFLYGQKWTVGGLAVVGIKG